MRVHNTYKNHATILAHWQNTYGYRIYWHSMNILGNILCFVYQDYVRKLKVAEPAQLEFLCYALFPW
jgi:hypothetical protein